MPYAHRFGLVSPLSFRGYPRGLTAFSRGEGNGVKMGREARNRLLVLRSRAMAIFGDGEVLE